MPDVKGPTFEFESPHGTRSSLGIGAEWVRPTTAEPIDWTPGPRSVAGAREAPAFRPCDAAPSRCQEPAAPLLSSTVAFRSRPTCPA